MITIYLAGAIRDDHLEEDVGWRETLIDRIDSLATASVRILNPLANKTFNPETKEWRVATLKINAKGTVGQDLWSVRRADVIVANFSSLSQNYPSIGTVMEVGVAAGIGGKLIYSIIEPDFSGHTNLGIFNLHPFLEQVSTEIFPSVKDCGDFLVAHLGMLTGWEPRFGGITNA